MNSRAYISEMARDEVADVAFELNSLDASTSVIRIKMQSLGRVQVDSWFRLEIQTDGMVTEHKGHAVAWSYEHAGTFQ